MYLVEVTAQLFNRMYCAAVEGAVERFYQIGTYRHLMFTAAFKSFRVSQPKCNVALFRNRNATDDIRAAAVEMSLRAGTRF